MEKLIIETLVGMINLKNYAEDRGKINISIFVLLNLEREIKEYFVFVVKAKTHKNECTQEAKALINLSVYSNKNSEDLEKLEKLASIRAK